MKKLLVVTLTAGMLAASTYAGDLWKVEDGSYVSNDLRSLMGLYNTQHGTNRYRAIRDILIAQGTLFPCNSGETVEAVAYYGGIAEIVDSNGEYFYIPQEDFVRYLGTR